MNPEYESIENVSDEPSLNDSGSIDAFLKQLEAREKDLDIPSDMVVEIEDYDVEQDELAELEKLLETYTPNKSFEPSIAPIFSNNKTFSDLETEIQKLNSEINKVSSEKQELAETMRRRSTDFENFRNRTERERAEIFRSVLSNLAHKILPVIDNLGRALDSAANHGAENLPDFQHFIDGVGLINHQLAEVLEGMGIQPIKSVGQPFDPHFHEAVATVSTDKVPPNTIVEELLRGYQIDNKVIRPSMVKVSSSINPTNLTSPEIELELE